MIPVEHLIIAKAELRQAEDEERAGNLYAAYMACSAAVLEIEAWQRLIREELRT
jgi:hypothetical protein